MPLFEELFSYVCGRYHVWDLGGQLLPFCQRCTGLYVGGLLALILLGLCRPRPTSTVLWIHGFLLLLMVPFGYQLVPQNAELRTLTGQLFAVGLVYYLALNPAARFRLWSWPWPTRTGLYAVGTLVEIIALQLAVRVGGPATAAVLAWLGFAGLVVYAVLAAANLVLLPPAIWRLVRGKPVESP